MPSLVSIIIPVRDDAESLARLLAQLPPQPDVEIIVALGGADAAIDTIRLQRRDVRWVDSPLGRGVQLNAGAAHASGEWLWFVHADSDLPEGWLESFRQLERPQATGNGKPATGHGQRATGHGPRATGDGRRATVGGSFRFALNSQAWQARVIERGVAARVRWLNLPYGDQGIFVRREVFTSIGGFQQLPLLEDVDLVGRLKRAGPLRHLMLSLTTSSRRWERDGWWRRSIGNLLILGLYWLGWSPDRLARRYYRR